MVSEQPTVETQLTHSKQEYVGGVRWRHINATWPFARLTISAEGLAVRPSSTRFRRLLLLLRVPILNVLWADVERIEEVRGVMPMSFGTSFVIDRKRLIWWCKSSDISDALMEELARYAPEKIARKEKRKLVF